jgi:hypothetical protein
LNADTIFLVGYAKAGLGPVMSMRDVLRFRDYLAAVLEYVERGLAGGQSKLELAALDVLPHFENFGSVPPNLTLGTFIEKIVDELSA